jgi:hypothetical protein
MQNNKLNQDRARADLIAKAADIQLDPNLDAKAKNIETLALCNNTQGGGTGGTGGTGSRRLSDWTTDELSQFIHDRTRVVVRRKQELALQEKDEDDKKYGRTSSSGTPRDLDE